MRFPLSLSTVILRGKHTKDPQTDEVLSLQILRNPRQFLGKNVKFELNRISFELFSASEGPVRFLKKLLNSEVSSL